MAFQPLILICNDRVTVVSAANYAELRASCDEAFGSLLTTAPPNHALALVYRWRGLPVEVLSDSSLTAFLGLCARQDVDAEPQAALVPPDHRGTPVLSVRQRPVLGPVQASPWAPHGPVQSPPPAARPYRQANHAPLRQEQSDRGTKPAAADRQGAAPAQRGVMPSAAPQPYASSDGHNQQRAKQLLASFKAPAAEDGPTVRVLLRDGSASTLVPFDPAAPPTYAAFRSAVWAGLRLDLVRATPEGSAAEEFLLSFWVEAQETPTDVEDDTDLCLMAELAQRFGAAALQVHADCAGSVLPVLPKTPRVGRASPAASPPRAAAVSVNSGSAVWVDCTSPPRDAVGRDDDRWRRPHNDGTQRPALPTARRM